MFQVETRTICSGWVNTWHEDDQPLVFRTFEEADTALAEFQSDLEDAQMEFNPEDYRIVPIPQVG